MAFKVCVLLGGLALLCSFSDARMQCVRIRDRDPNLSIEAENERQKRDTSSFSETENVSNDRSNNSCPPALISQDQEFCCYDRDMRPYCCDARSVVQNWSIIAALILIPLILLSTVVSCVSCLFCPCCCLYKRRRRRSRAV